MYKILVYKMYIKIVFIKTRCSINKILISVRIKSITMIKFMLKPNYI